MLSPVCAFLFALFAGGEGVWKIRLDPVDDDVSSFRIELEFASGEARQRMTLHNVRFADVWLCVTQWNVDAKFTSEQVLGLRTQFT